MNGPQGKVSQRLWELPSAQTWPRGSWKEPDCLFAYRRPAERHQRNAGAARLHREPRPRHCRSSHTWDPQKITKYSSPSTCLTSGSRNSENTWPCNTGVGMGLVSVRIVYVFQSQALGVTRYSGVEDLVPTLPTGKSQIQNDKSFIIG